MEPTKVKVEIAVLQLQLQQVSERRAEQHAQVLLLLGDLNEVEKTENRLRNELLEAQR